MEEITTSGEVINYLKKNLDKRNYLSMFITGSIPEQLVPQSDLDIFIIIKNSNRNQFFNSLTQIMDKFIINKKQITYSFYRGPLKYKYKGLIHFIIYTDIKTREGVSFNDEHLQLLKSFKEKAKIISGKTICELTSDIDWSLKEDKDMNKKWLKKKYDLFKKTKSINHKKWVKIGNNWKIRRIWKKPSKFLTGVLNEYYEKHLK